jgi:hypothetical protein
VPDGLPLLTGPIHLTRPDVWCHPLVQNVEVPSAEDLARLLPRLEDWTRGLANTQEMATQLLSPEVSP